MLLQSTTFLLFTSLYATSPTPHPQGDVSGDEEETSGGAELRALLVGGEIVQVAVASVELERSALAGDDIEIVAGHGDLQSCADKH